MRTARFRREQRGQVLVIVAVMIVVLLGFTGLVTDVAWYEVNLMRIQRAADAAALAGVVYLPSNVAGAQTAALAESSKNGFANGLNGVTVTATPEALNNRILGVTVSAPVEVPVPRNVKVRDIFRPTESASGGRKPPVENSGQQGAYTPRSLTSPLYEFR